MTKYKLFAGSQFYPHGGYEDYHGSFDSVQDALRHIERTYPDEWCYWCHVVENDKIIFNGECEEGEWNWGTLLDKDGNAETFIREKSLDDRLRDFLKSTGIEPDLNDLQIIAFDASGKAYTPRDIAELEDKGA